MSNSSPALSQLLRGEIIFDDEATAFSGATLYVTLEDVTYADADAIRIHELVKTDVAYAPQQPNHLTFEMPITIPNPHASYAVRAHIDVDGDHEISDGDYVNMQAYPVSTRGNQATISMRVSRVR